MIRERVKSGLERAKAQGKTLGRRHLSTPAKEAAIRADLRAGTAGIIKLAGLHGVGVGTVQRIKVGAGWLRQVRRGNRLLRPCEFEWRALRTSRLPTLAGTCPGLS